MAKKTENNPIQTIDNQLVEWRKKFAKEIPERVGLAFYTNEKGETEVEVYFADDTMWLSQATMAELFDVEEHTITYHIKEIYKSGELEENPTTQKIRAVRTEGNRQVNREIIFDRTNKTKEKIMNYQAHPTAVIDADCTIGNGAKIWHFSHIMPHCFIGENCNIGQNVVISPDVVLGRNVKIQNNVSVYTGVICEDDVFIGPSVVFTNVINPRSHVVRKNEYKQTLVRKGASIGANATIVCGNEIGEYAMIGAGAVITKPVKPYALMVGNPARQIGWVSEYGHTLQFDEKGVAICPETGERYFLQNECVCIISD